MKSVSDVIQEYKEGLLKTHSPITVKNYISDIWHFIHWTADNLKQDFSFDLLSKSTILDYQHLRGGKKDSFDDSLSKQSIERHISSLRSFSSFLLTQGIITENPFSEEKETVQDAWSLEEFKVFLRDKRASDLTIKYYINDIQSFRKWLQEVTGNFYAKEKLLDLLQEEFIEEYKTRLLHTMHLSPVSVNRKLSSLRNYMAFLKADIQTENISKGSQVDQSIYISDLVVSDESKSYSKNPIIRTVQKSADTYVSFEEKAAQKIADSIVSGRAKEILRPDEVTERMNKIDQALKATKDKNIKKEFYAPHAVSLKGESFYKKALHHIRHTRPKWYKIYHTYPLTHYAHFGVLMLATVVAGFYVYSNTFGKTTQKSILGISTPNKILSFKGQLLDNESKPITTPTDVSFALYTSATEGNSSKVWMEKQENVKPTENGFINLVLGVTKPVPQDLYSTQTPLYLGVTIGDGEELTPRKPIGPAFASNSETVQGMLPITSSSNSRNVLLALDSSGNLSIGGIANPKFEATGGDFTLTGETLILASNPSSNGNVVIAPDGNGKIEVQKALITTGHGANFGLENVVEIEGGLGIMATTSANAAFIINQNSRGELISASTGGILKFVVDNNGAITAGSWNAEILGTRYGGLGADISAVTAGELVYSLSASKYGTLKAGIKGQCLTAQGYAAPSWKACGGFLEENGALYTENNTLDLLIGANATSSAKFAFINVNSGTPTYKIGGTLSLNADGLIETLRNKDLKLGSNSTKNILLASSGNIGINTTDPKRTFDLNGTFGGNVDTYIDGAGDSTIERSTKALIYDLEKDTGSADSSTTTTYNITGLPEVDGTIAYLYLKVKKGITTGARQQTIAVKINSSATTIASVVNSNGFTTSSDEGIKHVTVLRSNGTWHVQGDPGLSNTADLAEWTPFSGAKPSPGEIVSINEAGKLVKSTRAFDPRLAGVVSTKPNITIGPATADSVRLALSGRIPVIVSSINGTITAGDAITSSIIPGIGMKPKRNSPIIGRALSSFSTSESCSQASSLTEVSWPEDDGTNTQQPCFQIPVSSFSHEIQNMLTTIYGYTSTDAVIIGKVIVLANLSWSAESDLLASVEGVTIESAQSSIPQGNLTELMDTLQKKTFAAKIGGQIIDNTTAFGSVAAANITAGLFKTSDAIVSGTLVAYNIVGNSISVVTADVDTLTAKTEITSPLATVNTLHADTIEPIAEDVKIKLSSPSSELAIVNGENEVVSSLDSGGNATFSGTVSTRTIDSQNVNTEGLLARSASISGTLTAGKLIADDIDGLENQVSSFATQFLKDYEQTANIPGYLLGDSILTASVSASFGTFHHGLISLGASTFGSLTAIDQISIGTDFTLANGGINTIGRALEIQPLRQGAVSFLAGAVVIQKDGRMVVSEDALFAKNVQIAGNLSAHVISPLPNQNIVLDPGNGQVEIKGASTSAVLSVNNQGNLTSSGSATFSKLNFQLVAKAVAANDLEAYATSSAGTAVIKAFRPELTIYNPQVTESSLIYVTPKNNTDNNVLFLLRQAGANQEIQGSEGSFTVGVSQLIDHDAEFNWLIVN